MNWANILTWSRLVLIAPISYLVWINEWQWALIVYVIAVMTDSLDGPVARITKTASESGAKLDGTIDLVFVGAVVPWLWRYSPGIINVYTKPLLVVAASFAIFMVLSLARHKTIITPHYWSGKLAMVLATLVFPVVLLFGDVPWFMYTTLIIAALGRIEIIIAILRGKIDLDARSAFSRA